VGKELKGGNRDLVRCTAVKNGIVLLFHTFKPPRAGK